MDIWIILLMIPIFLLVGMAIAMISIEEYHSNLLDLKDLLTEKPPYPQLIEEAQVEEDENDEEGGNSSEEDKDANDGDSEVNNDSAPQLEMGLLPMPAPGEVEERRKYFLALQTTKALQDASTNLETVKQGVMAEKALVDDQKKQLEQDKKLQAVEGKVKEKQHLLEREQLKNQAISVDNSKERLKAATSSANEKEAKKARDKLQEYNEALTEEKNQVERSLNVAQGATAFYQNKLNKEKIKNEAEKKSKNQKILELAKQKEEQRKHFQQELKKSKNK